jgi:hypothetical protein
MWSAVAFSRSPVNQGSAQCNNERIACDLRAMDRGIPSCQIASHLTSRFPDVGSPPDEVERSGGAGDEDAIQLIVEGPATATPAEVK